MKNQLLFKTGMLLSYIFVSFFLFLSETVRAYDNIYAKVAPATASYVKGNSILRTNDNSGLITAGTTENPNNPAQKEVNVIKTDDAGNVIFSMNYSTMSHYDMYCHRINHNINKNGYILIGTAVWVNTNDTTFQPFVIEIDEAGNIINAKVLAQLGLAFLDGTSTADGNYVFTGFKGRSVADLQTERVGIVVKTDASFNMTWMRDFMSGYVFPNNFNHRWNIGEKIIAFTHNGQEKYFITGGTQRPSNPAPGINVVALSLLVDQNGNILWNASCMDFEFGVDAVYDPQTENIYLLANRADPSGDVISHLYRFSVTTGSYNYGYFFEGISTVQPIGFHHIYSYKLQLKNNKAIVFGLLRNYYQNPGLINHDSLYNPFRLEFEINNPANYAFTLFKKATQYYEQNNRYDFLLGTYCTTCNYMTSGANQLPPQIVTQDMGVEYTKNGSDYYAIVSPNKENLTSTVFPQVSIINSFMGQYCNVENPAVRFIESKPMPICNLVYSQPQTITPTINVPQNRQPRNLAISACELGNYNKFSTTQIAKVDIDNKQLKLYPQPANGKIQISIDNLSLENATITVYDITGVQVKDVEYHANQGIIFLATNELTPGIYLLNIVGESYHFQARMSIVR